MKETASDPEKKTYRPRRSVLYLAFLRLLFGITAAQAVLFLAKLRRDPYFDAGPEARANFILFGGIVVVGLWVIECAVFFSRKTRLSIDDRGLSFVDTAGTVDANWSEVTDIKRGRWEIFISTPERVVGMPLLTRDEQREINTAWFKVKGFSIANKRGNPWE